MRNAFIIKIAHCTQLMLNVHSFFYYSLLKTPFYVTKKNFSMFVFLMKIIIKHFLFVLRNVASMSNKTVPIFPQQEKHYPVIRKKKTGKSFILLMMGNYN